jgi:hemin uptake protein HemP
MIRASHETRAESPVQSVRGRAIDQSVEPTRSSSVQTVRAVDLLGPSRLLRIELDGEIYTLRLTRNERLILTK